MRYFFKPTDNLPRFAPTTVMVDSHTVSFAIGNGEFDDEVWAQVKDEKPIQELIKNESLRVFDSKPPDVKPEVKTTTKKAAE